MAKRPFVHLHVHSHYSLLDGLGKTDELIERAKELEMPALALTDHGVMYGAIEFFLAAQKADLKPIIGQEIYVSPRRLSDKSPGLDTRAYHLILLAQNLQGYLNLIKLTSIANLEGYYYKPRIDRETLSKYSEGLIASSGCLISEVARSILDKDFDKTSQTIEFYKEVFGKDRYYLELQHHPSIDEQQVVNERIKYFAQKHNVPLIATNDVHYVKSEDRVAHDMLVCIQTGKLITDADRMIYSGDFSLKGVEDFETAFPDVPEAIDNTVKIADMIDLKIPMGKHILPHFPLPEGQTEESLLKDWCEKGLKNRYNHISTELRERLNYELEIVIKMGFPGYFLIVADFIAYAHRKGIYIGPGRGSAAGSLIAYVLGITNIDPIKYGLLFERFLDVSRVTMPDIDMDFEDTRRKEVVDYVREKYGDDHVAGVITFGTIMARAAVRDAGRVMGMQYNTVDKIAKKIPPPIQGRHIPLVKSIKNAPELKHVYDTDPEATQLLDAAIKLEGTVRHASQHACAIVISKDPLDQYVAVQQAQGGDVHQVTQYSMDPIDKIGLLKMDFLGLSNLTIMHNAVDIIEAVYGKKIDIEGLPLDDKKTFELLGRGETTGVFQLECLSGDTIISNTTIKTLYEKHHKTKLESIYVDEGKIHKNKIIKVIKGKSKKLFCLVTKNGRYIKASAEHNFLTTTGWKELKAIQPGDLLLQKIKAKHSTFNQCSTCKKQIDGQREGKSKFCYRCSALHYRNPSKLISRQKISNSRVRFYASGGEPWNKGMSKENNPILANTGLKISRALTGITYEDRYGLEEAQKRKALQSQAMSGKNNHMFGKKSPHAKGGYRPDLKHYVRSNWEADFARILKLSNLEYEYEPQTFSLTLPGNKPVNYTPDFYVPSLNTYYEIKGWMHDLDRQKIEAFTQQYPAIKLEVISATKFAEFALKYRDLVKWECPRIPAEQSFEFIEVEKILPAGIEETYDIAMESPGNNYVANSFVVHNSDGMKRYIRELKPDKFEDIIAMVALYRPGPIQWIDSFVKRKNNLEKVEYLHPLAQKAMKETYGIPVYQEQVMQMSKDMCGFSGAEADTLRKAIGKKIPKLMREMKEKFISGAVERGVEQHKAEQIWTQLEDFAAYCFNKSHATCYAMIAYQTAYLKAHFPDCFMAALMTSDIDNIDRLSIEISESERMGMSVLPPDVNESFADFAVVKDSKSIRFGLGAIKNVGVAVAKAIVRERKTNGSFSSLENFLQRNGSTLNKKVLESMVKAGALDRFNERGSLYAGLELLVKYASQSNDKNSGNQISIFSDNDNKNTLAQLNLPAGANDQNEFLAWEKELLGLYLSAHPLKEFAETLNSATTPINEISTEMANKTLRIGGMIHEIKKITTKSSQIMAFIKLEDLTGEMEVVAFPSVFHERPDLWIVDKMVIVQGKVSDKDGTAKLLADRVFPLEMARNGLLSPLSQGKEFGNVNAQKVSAQSQNLRNNPPSNQKLFVIDLPRSVTKPKIEELRDMLKGYPGETPVELRIIQNGNTKIVRTTLKIKDCEEVKQSIDNLFGAQV